MPQYKRVHVMGNDGNFYQAPYAKCTETGEMRPMPVTSSGAIDARQIAQKGCPVAVIDNGATAQNNQSMFNKNSVVALAEKPTGQITTVRPEVAADFAGGKGGVKFVINVANADGAAQTIVLGDKSGELRRRLGIAEKDVDVTVSSTFGASTYDIFRDISGEAALDLHGLQIQCFTTAGAASSAFYDTGILRTAVAPAIPNLGIRETTHDLSAAVSQQTFLPNIRQVELFRFQVGFFSGIILTIPAGIQISLSFSVVSAGTGSLMELLQN